MKSVVKAFLIAGTADIILALSKFYLETGNNPLRVLHFIASGVMGNKAFEGGFISAATGLIFHYIVTFVWTFAFYKWYPFPIGFGEPQEGVYETQSQIFSKKFTVKEVRVYAEPWVANNSFQVDLIGSAGTPMTNGSATFTVGTNLTAGTDIAEYNPKIAPSYVFGVRLTNLGTVNHTINKVEIDVVQAGK